MQSYSRKDFTEVVLASTNSGKLLEIQEACADLPWKFLLQSDFHLPEAEETGVTFVENAILKARHASQATGLPALADDSGLEVDVLGGAPGVYSARYAGIPRDRTRNINKLLEAMLNVPLQNRTARFQCVIVLLRHPNDAAPLICQGTWEGHILFESQGTKGFGYDPIFYVPTHHCSAAELPPATKHLISHRGQALAQLKKMITTIKENRNLCAQY